MDILKRVALHLLLIAIIPACKQEAKKPVQNAADTSIIINSEKLSTKRKNVYADIDISPMDMSYFPPNYPQLKMSDSTLPPPVMRVIYSRPHLQGRQLFHDILKYDEPWRLGANEATELQVYQPVSVNNYKLAPGRYTLHCIPHQKEWTIAFNTDTDMWGLKYDPARDLFRVKASITHNNQSLEYFTMVFEQTASGGNLLMAWGDMEVKLPFTF